MTKLFEQDYPFVVSLNGVKMAVVLPDTIIVYDVNNLASFSHFSSNFSSVLTYTFSVSGTIISYPIKKYKKREALLKKVIKILKEK